MQVPLFWITVFVNILQLSFSIYLFLIWTWLSDRQTLVSVYIQRNPALRPPRLYNHLVSPPVAFRPRRENLRVILLFWRPLQCDHLAILRPGFYGLNAGRINVNIPKVGSAGRLTHLVQSPFCNGMASLLAGPTILQKHFTRFSENPRAQWNGPVRHRPNKSHREFGYRACKQDTDQHPWGK